MSRVVKSLAALGLALLGSAALSWSLGAQAPQLETDFKANDLVQSITVKIDVGGDGADLSEPVALHLGLGFPLWLHPVGRKADERPPFGAVPQQTTAAAQVRAGSSVTFTFALKGEEGQDAYQMTPQLLAGLRVSDIAGVGFASQGTSDWVLAGYEIRINDRLFASGTEAQSVKKAQEASRTKLSELAQKLVPLQTEWTELSALVKTELATADDRKRLQEMTGALAALAAEKNWLEGQLQGKYPWFAERAFKSPWRDQPLVKSARVTVVTAPHTFADTSNYVYFRTGGRKYLLSSPDNPLTGAAGPQRFVLDLQAGPLTAADLRGWALGMLAHANPYGKSPDRHHPSRLLVEIDNRVVYDSDENDLDRRSLEAIRLIPPRHKDQNGQVVSNTPVAREAFVWEAGKGLGLDEAGSPLALGEPGDATYPKSEPVPPREEDAKEQPKEEPREEPKDSGTTPLFEGEKEVPGYWQEVPQDGGAYPNGTVPDGGFPGGGAGGWDGGGGGGGGWGGGGLQFDLQLLLQGLIPTPAGTPPQVTNVQVTHGWKTDDTFTVTFQVSGDENMVDHYEVSLREMDPTQANPYAGTEYALNLNVPRGGPSFTITAAPAGLAAVANRHLFLVPVVRAIPADPAVMTTFTAIGPARTIFPAGSSVTAQPTNLKFKWRHKLGGGGFGPWGAYFFMPAGDTGGPGAKSVGQIQWDNDILFAPASPGKHILVRPGGPGGADEIRVLMQVNKAEFAGAVRHFVAHLGFSGGPGATGTVTANLTFQWKTAADVLVPMPFIPQIKSAVAGQEMQVFDYTLDPTLPALAAAHHLDIIVTFSGAPFDSAHPPALFGVRLVP